VRHLPSLRPSALAVTALVASLACASSNTNNDPDTHITTRQLSSPGSRPIETTDLSSTDFVPVKGSQVEAMTALTQIYAQMQIPIATMIQDAGQIGNQNLRLATHRLHGHMVSFYLNCGQESMVGSRADLDEVTISILTNVKTRDSVTVVGTTVQGWARPSGTSSNAVDCESTGELEKAIAAQAQNALGVPAAPTKSD
jgi:hypothetical protein